jgi:NAD-dependent deacetylase
MQPVDLSQYPRVVFFTGAGLSAESGMPTYRGSGGIWQQYHYREFACQDAFDRDPSKVQEFHEIRRAKALACEPHAGHRHIAVLQGAHRRIDVITQNIDGMLQRAGVRVGAELHGSLWRVRCACGIRQEDAAAAYAARICMRCKQPVRPDIVWFEDRVNEGVFMHAAEMVGNADVFIGVGTSGAVWPAAGFAEQARRSGARMIEINPEENEASRLYGEHLRLPASRAIPEWFPATR